MSDEENSTARTIKLISRGRISDAVSNRIPPNSHLGARTTRTYLFNTKRIRKYSWIKLKIKGSPMASAWRRRCSELQNGFHSRNLCRLVAMIFTSRSYPRQKRLRSPRND